MSEWQPKPTHWHTWSEAAKALSDVTMLAHKRGDRMEAAFFAFKAAECVKLARLLEPPPASAQPSEGEAR